MSNTSGNQIYNSANIPDSVSRKKLLQSVEKSVPEKKANDKKKNLIILASTSILVVAITLIVVLSLGRTSTKEEFYEELNSISLNLDQAMYAENNTSKGAKYVDELKKIREKATDEEEKFEVSSIISSYYYYSGDYYTAITELKEVNPELLSSTKKVQYASALVTLYRSYGLIEEAKSSANNALNILNQNRAGDFSAEYIESETEYFKSIIEELNNANE